MRFSHALPSLTLALGLVPVALTAQVSREHNIPLKPWAAPLYWQPTQPDSHAGAVQPDATVSPAAQTAATSLVFVGMTPCRVADTRSAPSTVNVPYPGGKAQNIGPRMNTKYKPA